MFELKYQGRVWCSDCIDDPMGCFCDEEGRCVISDAFASKEEAQSWAEDFIGDCAPWEYEILEVS